MGYRKYSVMRATTGITVNAEALRKAQDLGLNVSKICSDAIELAIAPDRQKERLEQELTLITERESAAAKEKEASIEEFKKLSGNVLTDEVKLLYWSKKTGLSSTELKALWRNEIGNAQHVSE